MYPKYELLYFKDMVYSKRLKLTRNLKGLRSS